MEPNDQSDSVKNTADVMTEDTTSGVKPDSGSWQEYGLSVAWRSNLVDDQINVDVILEFGGKKQNAYLSRSQPSDRFSLSDGQQTVSGIIELSYGELVELCLQARFGNVGERRVDIHNWLICTGSEPCDATSGDVDLQQGWSASWWVAGSKKYCMESSVVLSCGSSRVGVASLSPSVTRWVTNLPPPDQDLECSVRQRITADGRANLTATLPSTSGEGQKIDQVLAEWSGTTPIPVDPTVSPGSTNRVVIGRQCSGAQSSQCSVERPVEGDGDVVFHSGQDDSGPLCCSCFTYPKALQSPTDSDISLRFVSIANTGSFQSALTDKRTGSDARKNMLTEAADFASGSGSYSGQYVSQVSGMPTPFNRLVAPGVEVFLNSRPKDPEQLTQELDTLLDTRAADFVGQSDYSEQKSRLQDSLTAELVLASRQTEPQNAFVAALMVCHVAEIIVNSASLITGSTSIQAVLTANVQLDTDIFPVPLATTSTGATTASPYLRILGIAEFMLLEYRLLYYQMGKLAHVENVMRGQTREIATSSVQESASADLTQSNTHNSNNADELLGGQSDLSPLLGIKKTFENIQQQYDTSGLNVTLSGDYFELPGDYSGTSSTPFNYVSEAQKFARSVERRFVDKLESSVEQHRHQLARSLFSSRHMHRYQNVSGEQHLVGLYRWITEVFNTHLYRQGERLMVEFVLPAPAANFIARQNDLFDQNLHLPTAPYDPNATNPIHSPADITRDNYLDLANKYLAEGVQAPPTLNLTTSQTLMGDPPLAAARLKTPAQYQAVSIDVSYAYITPEGTSSVTIDLLVGGQTQNLTDPSPGKATINYAGSFGAELPVAVITSAVDYAITLTLNCQLDDQSDLYLAWQTQTFNAVMVAYERDKRHYMEALESAIDSLALNNNGGDNLGFQEQQLKQQGIQLLISMFQQQDVTTTDDWCEDVINFQLIPFFDCALSWRDMTISYYPDYFGPDDSGRPDWLKLEQQRQVMYGGEHDLSAFLSAGSARIIVPVASLYTQPVIYYLGTEGRFWFGEPERAPVPAAELSYVNSWKKFLLSPGTFIDEQQWKTEIPTSMMVLDPSSELPEFSQEEPASPLTKQET